MKTLIDTTIHHVFAAALTIDGTPVNAKTITTKRGIMSRLTDEDGGWWVRVPPARLHHLWRDQMVYLWADDSYLTAADALDDLTAGPV
jgi:hypothetical protein